MAGFRGPRPLRIRYFPGLGRVLEQCDRALERPKDLIMWFEDRGLVFYCYQLGKGFVSWSGGYRR